MKTQVANYAIALFAASFLLACESNEEPTLRVQLDEVGFVGSLPDGSTFSASGIKTSNAVGLSGNSADGGFVSHILAIRDEVSGIDITLQLPEIKFQESGNVLALDAKNLANQHYSYDEVKGKLAVGNKNIPFETSDKWENNFYITVLDQRNFKGYTLTPGQLRTTDFLRVTQLIEGTEQNVAGENIRTMDVIFELELQLQATDASLSPQGNLKGLLRMKYRENFDQSEFEAN